MRSQAFYVLRFAFYEVTHDAERTTHNQNENLRFSFLTSGPSTHN